MDKEDLMMRITVDPSVMVGKPTIRGLRITVDQILSSLAAGISEKDILDDLPELMHEDIQAVLHYAARRVSEERVFQVG